MLLKALHQFQLKTYKTALEDLRGLNVKMDDLQSNTLIEFELLHQWRQRYASIIDEEPSLVASTYTLLKICRLTFERFVSVEELKQHQQSNSSKYQQSLRAIQSSGLPSATAKNQSHTILRVLSRDSKFFNRLDNFECRNCLKNGHAVIHCPFERLPAAEQERRYNFKHPERKQQQYERRSRNSSRNQAERRGQAQSSGSIQKY